MSRAEVLIPRRLTLRLLALAQRRGPRLDALVLARGGFPERIVEATSGLDAARLTGSGSTLWARVLDAHAPQATAAPGGEPLRLLVRLDTRGVLQLSAYRWRHGRWLETALATVD
ncbi:MAG: hypothetical protein KGJ55_00775 [Gammaproteobacteria bacterium]|nr:hypothetical protein [Gammaproteobacteria bacterium]